MVRGWWRAGAEVCLVGGGAARAVVGNRGGGEGRGGGGGRCDGASSRSWTVAAAGHSGGAAAAGHGVRLRAATVAEAPVRGREVVREEAASGGGATYWRGPCVLGRCSREHTARK